jgi:hypothetical protein
VLEQFHYTNDAGVEITLPRFENISFGIVRKLRKEPEAEQFCGLVETVAPEETLAILDDMSQAEIQKLMLAWQKDSGLTPGESSASSTS